jgi:hypothetical protein
VLLLEVFEYDGFDVGLLEVFNVCGATSEVVKNIADF